MDTNVYRTILPAKELTPFVRRYMVADCVPPENFTVQPRPTGYNYLNWLIEGEWRGQAGEFSISLKDDLFFAGQIKNSEITLMYVNLAKHIVVEFTALGFYRLVGIEGSSLLNVAVPANQLDIEFAKKIDDMKGNISLDASSSTEEYLELLEAFLIDQAKQALELPSYLYEVVDLIENNDGSIKLKEIFQSVKVSQRQLIRRFTNVVGVGPKYFARVLQMNRALQAMLENDLTLLSAIATEYGYYDESHLIRSVKEFFGEASGSLIESQQETMFAFLGESRKIKTTS